MPVPTSGSVSGTPPEGHGATNASISEHRSRRPHATSPTPPVRDSRPRVLVLLHSYRPAALAQEAALPKRLPPTVTLGHAFACPYRSLSWNIRLRPPTPRGPDAVRNVVSLATSATGRILYPSRYVSLSSPGARVSFLEPPGRQIQPARAPTGRIGGHSPHFRCLRYPRYLGFRFSGCS